MNNGKITTQHKQTFLLACLLHLVTFINWGKVLYIISPSSSSTIQSILFSNILPRPLLYRNTTYSSQRPTSFIAPQPKSMGTRIWILNTWDFFRIDPLFSVHLQPVSDLWSTSLLHLFSCFCLYDSIVSSLHLHSLLALVQVFHLGVDLVTTLPLPDIFGWIDPPFYIVQHLALHAIASKPFLFPLHFLAWEETRDTFNLS